MPITDDVICGNEVRFVHPDLSNIFGCSIGRGTMVGPFVEIQRGATIGERCKIQSHSFICEGVSIGDQVFVGHGVVFTNDRWPRATNLDGTTKTADDWVLETTSVGVGAAIGSGSTVLPGLTIGQWALIGAGSVVTKSVPDFAIVVGNPARVVGDVRTAEPGMENIS